MVQPMFSAAYVTKAGKGQPFADYAHLQNTVLLPAAAHARERQLITPQEEAVLQNHHPRRHGEGR